MIVSVTRENFVNSICVVIFQIEADNSFPKSFLAKRITPKARTILWTSNWNRKLKNSLRIYFILAKCSGCGQSEIIDVVTQEFCLSNSVHPQLRIIMIIIRVGDTERAHFIQVQVLLHNGYRQLSIRKTRYYHFSKKVHSDRN